MTTMDKLTIDFLLLFYIALMVTAIAIGHPKPIAKPCVEYGMIEAKIVLIDNKTKTVTYQCEQTGAYR
jgi:hypothetical protein